MKKKTTKAAKSSPQNNTSLSDDAVLEAARTRVAEFLPLAAEGYACTTGQLSDVLLCVAVKKETLEQVCADLNLTVGAQTMRDYLNQQLKVANLSDLQEALKAALRQGVGAELKKQPLEVALDFHDQSYYGKTEQSQGLWVGAQAKNGTTKGYRVATL